MEVIDAVFAKRSMNERQANNNTLGSFFFGANSSEISIIPSADLFLLEIRSIMNHAGNNIPSPKNSKATCNMGK